MKYVCPDCGFEANDPGNCPSCETPLLRREDELGAVEEPLEEEESDEELVEESGEPEDLEEEW